MKDVIPHPPPGETVYAENRFSLRCCRVPLRGGGTRKGAIIVHPGAVTLLPLTDDGRIVLIRNQRWQLGQRLWELPAGGLEPGEDPLAAAARELEEETGYRAAELEALQPLFAGIGTTEVLYPFVARGLTLVGQKLEPDEDIEVVPVTLSEARRMLLEGDIIEMKTVAFLSRFFLQREFK